MQQLYYNPVTRLVSSSLLSRVPAQVVSVRGDASTETVNVIVVGGTPTAPYLPDAGEVLGIVLRPPANLKQGCLAGPTLLSRGDTATDGFTGTTSSDTVLTRALMHVDPDDAATELPTFTALAKLYLVPAGGGDAIESLPFTWTIEANYYRPLSLPVDVAEGTVRQADDTRPWAVAKVENQTFAGGATCNLANLAGPGNVASLQIALAGATGQRATLVDSVVRITVDGTTLPDIPLGLLFLSHVNNGAVDGSNTFGVEGLALTAFFPTHPTQGYGAMGGLRDVFIPYQSNCRIDLILTGSDMSVYSQVEYYTGPIPSSTRRGRRGHLRAAVIPWTTVAEHASLQALNVVGTGRLDSVQLVSRGPTSASKTSYAWLEGNPSVVVDGTTQTYGGTEDFFKTQFYGDYSPGRLVPSGGLSKGSYNDGTARDGVFAYRRWDTAPLHFNTGLALSFAAGQAGQGLQGWGSIQLSALALYYADDDSDPVDGIVVAVDPSTGDAHFAGTVTAAGFARADGTPLGGGSGGATVHAVADDAAKRALTGLQAGDYAVINGEGGRVEQFVPINGGASDQANWPVLRDTVNLTVCNQSETDATVNGVLVQAGGVDYVNVGWVDPRAVSISPTNTFQINVIYDALGTAYSVALPATLFSPCALPVAFPVRSALTVFLGAEQD